MILKTLFNAIIQRNDFDKYRAFRKLNFQGLSASECLSVSAAVIEPFCKVRRAKLIYIHKYPTTNAAVVQQSK